MKRKTPRLAIVIPTLDESERLPRILQDVERLDLDVEVVVSDGGSEDGTVDVARALSTAVIVGARGRARQLHAGAQATTAPWLLFLHADSRLPADARRALVDFLLHARENDFAHFGFALEGDEWFWRFIEFGQRLRERAYGLVYGDQGLIVHRSLYENVSGYPEWDVLEDVGLVDRLDHVGTRHRLESAIVTNPRRYEADGRWTRWLRNVWLITLFRLGVAPNSLAPSYPPREHTTAGVPARRGTGTEAIIVFAKAPREGQVKTRLAADIGAAEALRIYRQLGRGVVDRLRRAGRPITVYFTPSDGESDVRSWLGDADLAFRPQADGDLGQRMAAAFTEVLTTAAAACIVGTDVPGVDETSIERAFADLTDNDVVIGPAEDGGYYLLALRQIRTELFDSIPWSTETVCAETISRARDLGLVVGHIPVLADVDRGADVPAEMLS